MNAPRLRTIGPWTVFLDDDEFLVPMNHPAIPVGRRWADEGVAMIVGGREVRFQFDPDGLPDGLSAEEALERYSPAVGDALVIPTFWCEDLEGLKALTYTADIRALRTSKYGDNLPSIGSRGFAVSGETLMGYCGYAAVVKVPHAQRALASGDYRLALELSAPYNNLAFFRRIELKATELKNTNEALTAFERLYVHMSLNEELWRLGQIFKHLPFDLEEHPRVLELFAQYRRQTGHLDDVTKWYAEGSPSEVLNDWYIENAAGCLSTRLGWIGVEATKLGYKRVVELGAIDGSSLFPLMARFPAIEWHGVEVSQPAVAHGKALAAKHGLLDKLKLHHAKSFRAFSTEVSWMDDKHWKGHPTDLHRFDAAMVFEVLEHNTPEDGRLILETARDCVKPGGRIFVTTPCGNWSLFDKKTQDLEIRKDHILAYTPKRMRELLESLPFAADIKVERVENSVYADNNAWVFASFEVK